MRCACVDIGSNTTRLLVAEPGDGRLRRVLERRAFLHLPSDGRAIPAERLAALTQTVRGHVAAAEAAGAHDIVIVATAAVRGTANRDEVCAAIARTTGHPVAVLAGADEARAAFRGATAGRVIAGTVAVVDVGGGSTEIVTGTIADGAGWSVSLPVGSGSLTEDEAGADPPGPRDRERMRARIAAVLQDVRPPPVVAALAVGGSAASVRQMAGGLLDAASLARAQQAVCALPAAAVAGRYGLHAERARLLPAGLLLLAAAADVVGHPLEVAAGGLREGILLERVDGDG